MGRILDEKEVIKVIDRHTKEDGTLDNDISCILEEVKTAYDVGKVVDELKSKKNNSDYITCFYNSTIDDVIDIVRKGGTKWD